MTSYISPFTGDVVVPTEVSYVSYALTSSTGSLQLVWPANGSDANDVAARIMDVTTTSTSYALLMPPASQASVGTDALIRNTGATALAVQTTGGTSIVTVAAGTAQYIYLTNNSTANGVWGVFTFGAGTSSADAATLAGYGLLASGLTLNQSHPTVSLVNGYTFTTADRAQVQVWPTSGGAGTVTLPLASTLGANWFALLKNNGTGTLSLGTTSSELLDGTSSAKLFAPGDSAFIICTGTSYVTVGYGVSTQFTFTALTKPVVSGTYTLTASEASNTIQAYTGALTGNVTVYFPPVVNLYVISNQTTGAYTLTLGTTSGLTVQVPSNTQATVVCDGTNFFNANTTTVGGSVVSMVNGSASNPSLYFATETNTGIYRPGGGQFGISILGNLISNTTATGLAVTGTGNFTGGVSGGTF
jgi:hypothetical protein